MTKSTKFSPEVRERAVRMVFDAKDQYESQWAAIVSIAGKIGCTPESLRRWIRQQERDTGQRPGTTSAEAARVKELEREVRELKKANEILRLASAYFAQAELDRSIKSQTLSLMSIGTDWGSSRSAVCCRSPHRPTAGRWPGKTIRRYAASAPYATSNWAAILTASGRPIIRCMVRPRSGVSLDARDSA